jgi:uncharacterized protein (TIGR00251 family)
VSGAVATARMRGRACDWRVRAGGTARMRGGEGGGMTAEAAITVAVKVHPGASREAVTLLPDGSLDVRLRARAIEGQANAGLIDVLAARLGLRRRDIAIASGVRSRQKLVRLALPSSAALQQRLGGEAGA